MQHPIFFFQMCTSECNFNWETNETEEQEAWKYNLKILCSAQMTCIYSSLSLWNLCLSHQNRAWSQRASKWAGVYTQPVQLATVQIQTFESNTLLFSATCLVLAGRHGWLYMLTYTPCWLHCLQKAKFTQLFTTEELRLNNIECLKLYQVFTLGPFEVPALQLKTDLRATSFSNNMPSAAELCQTSTRNTPQLLISYSSHTLL